ncbi:MAG: hypothetical protein CMF59_12600 [Leptospiraceae bacterium]|nr:hypothetical protein [Leptospiraceae bacterium]
MENTMEIVGPRIFSVPGIEIRMQMGRFYVNGQEVPAEQIRQQSLKFVTAVHTSGTYEVPSGGRNPDTVSIGRDRDFREP